ncbi:hypothetical protein [Actinospica robiniae]|uniref:hypothetical protein n=1 Tax=Actinospica robiniae TaxID=304901 RepID=UPI0012F71D74|nr:hypothetical protein [Actinospica robiniae]
METAALIEKWRSIIIGDQKSWVLFANGTCVILMQPEGDLADQATELVREYGPVAAGGPAGDFGTQRRPRAGRASHRRQARRTRRRQRLTPTAPHATGIRPFRSG